MKGKLFLAGAIAFCVSSAVSAQELGFGGLLKSASFGSLSAIPNLSLTADGDTGAYQDYTAGERAGLIGLNLLFGTGSYMTGHIVDGVILTACEAVGIVGVVLPFILNWKVELSGKEDNKGTEGYSEALTPESNYAIICWVGGGMLIITEVILNIIWTLDYSKPQPKTAEVTDLRNWNVAFFPQSNDRVAGQITFTAHF